MDGWEKCLHKKTHYFCVYFSSYDERESNYFKTNIQVVLLEIHRVVGRLGLPIELQNYQL